VPAVHWTDSEAGVPGHGAVQGAVRQQRAVDVVGGVGRHGADHVRRVDVLEGDGEVGLLLEMLLIFWESQSPTSRSTLLPEASWVSAKGMLLTMRSWPAPLATTRTMWPLSRRCFSNLHELEEAALASR